MLKKLLAEVSLPVPLDFLHGIELVNREQKPFNKVH